MERSLYNLSKFLFIRIYPSMSEDLRISEQKIIKANVSDKKLIINGFSLFLVVSQRRNIYLFVFNFVTSISMLMLVIKLNHAELISPDDRHNRNLNHYQHFKYLLLSTFCN